MLMTNRLASRNLCLGNLAFVIGLYFCPHSSRILHADNQAFATYGHSPHGYETVFPDLQFILILCSWRKLYQSAVSRKIRVNDLEAFGFIARLRLCLE